MAKHRSVPVNGHINAYKKKHQSLQRRYWKRYLHSPPSMLTTGSKVYHLAPSNPAVQRRKWEWSPRRMGRQRQRGRRRADDKAKSRRTDSENIARDDMAMGAEWRGVYFSAVTRYVYCATLLADRSSFPDTSSHWRTCSLWEHYLVLWWGEDARYTRAAVHRRNRVLQAATTGESCYSRVRDSHTLISTGTTRLYRSSTSSCS